MQTLAERPVLNCPSFLVEKKIDIQNDKKWLTNKKWLTAL